MPVRVCVCVCIHMYVYEGVCVCTCVSMHCASVHVCSSVVRAFAHGALGCRIDPSWGGPIELFLIPASAPRLL